MAPLKQSLDGVLISLIVGRTVSPEESAMLKADEGYCRKVKALAASADEHPADAHRPVPASHRFLRALGEVAVDRGDDLHRHRVSAADSGRSRFRCSSRSGRSELGAMYARL